MRTGTVPRVPWTATPKLGQRQGEVYGPPTTLEGGDCPGETPYLHVNHVLSGTKPQSRSGQWLEYIEEKKRFRIEKETRTSPVCTSCAGGVHGTGVLGLGDSGNSQRILDISGNFYQGGGLESRTTGRVSTV